MIICKSKHLKPYNLENQHTAAPHILKQFKYNLENHSISSRKQLKKPENLIEARRKKENLYESLVLLISVQKSLPGIKKENLYL